MSLVSDKATTRLQQSPVQRSRLKLGFRSWCALLERTYAIILRTAHQALRKSSGSLAILAGIRRASSLVSGLAADSRVGLFLKIDIDDLLAVAVANDKGGLQFFDGPGWREASRYSSTSSAVASSEGGTAMPSSFAVLRLMTVSKLVGCSTGISAGFAPLRIRSTISAPRCHRAP
jgi:hypothetical protein